MSFLKTKIPKVNDIPVPDRSDSEVQQAADDQRRAMASKSKATSWLTGGVGVPRNTQTFAAAKLLSGTA